MKKKLKQTLKISSLSIFIIAIAVIIFGQSCSSAKYNIKDSKMTKIEKSNNYKKGKFLNYKGKMEMNFMKSIPLIWEFLFSGNDRTPNKNLPSQKVDFSKIKNAEEDELKVTWIGHSSIILNIDGKIILTDPVYESNTVFLGPSRYNGDVPLKIADLPEIDLVLISHNHYDHLNSNTIESIHPKVKQFIVPLMVGAQLEEMGVPRDKILELDWWEEFSLDNHFFIALTPTQHFSGRGLFDRDETLWGSYVIKGPHHKVFFSGDSGYFDGFKEIGNKYGPFDYTLLECGAYNKRWHYVHMMPEETTQAHLDLKGKILHPIHWGTFNLALHSWYDPMIRIAKSADDKGIKLSTPIVGQTIRVDENLNTERWWEKIIELNN